jgi:hypothetical protein
MTSNLSRMSDGQMVRIQPENIVNAPDEPTSRFYCPAEILFQNDVFRS